MYTIEHQQENVMNFRMKQLLLFNNNQTISTMIRALFFFFILLLSFNIHSQSCLDFDGVDDFANASSNAISDIGAGDFTIEFWIKGDAAEIDGVYPLLSNRSKSGLFTIDGFMVFFHPSSSGPALSVQLNGSNYFIDNEFTSNNPILDNECHHLVITRHEYDLSFYFDGIHYGTKEGGNVFSDISNSKQKLNIGFDVVDDKYTNIIFSEIRIWNIVRGPNSMSSNELKGSEPGLVANWRLNEGSGLTSMDISPNGYDLKLGGDPVDKIKAPQWSVDCCVFECSAECDTTTLDLSTGHDIYGSPIANGQHQSKWRVVDVPQGSGVNAGLFPYILNTPGDWTDIAGAKYISPFPMVENRFNNFSTNTSFDFESCFCVCADDSDITIDISAYADNALNVDLYQGTASDNGTFLYDILDISRNEKTGAFNGPTFDATVNYTLATGQYCLKAALQNDGTQLMGLSMKASVSGAGLIKSECCSASNGLTGFCYDDKDCDGVYNRNSDGLLANVQVSALDSDENVVQVTTTDDYGLYTFSNLGEGSFTVEFDLPLNYELVAERTFPVVLGTTDVVGSLNFGFNYTGPVTTESLGSSCAAAGGTFEFEWCGQSCDCNMRIFARPCGSSSQYELIGSTSNKRSYKWNIPVDFQGDYEFMLIDCDQNEYPFEGCLTIADYSIEIAASKEDCGVYSFNATLIGTTSSISSYQWYFGENLYSSEASPTQDFAYAGEYRICVSIKTEDNCSLSKCIDLDISEGVEDDCNFCPPNVVSEIESGDLFIHDGCYGVIIQSPNGSCFRISVTDEGKIVSVPVECPGTIAINP